MKIVDSLPKFGYQTLLVCMAILFALIPISQHTPGTEVIVKTGFTLVLLASVYRISNKTHQAVIGILLAIPALTGHWMDYVNKITAPYVVQFVFTIALQVYVTYIMLTDLFRSKTIDRNILYGAVCIYIMIGLIFGSCFALVEILKPGSFIGLDKWIQIEIVTATGAAEYVLFFFSFITLTTTGFGNIAPHSVLTSALCSAEALIGQLYMTILVARLVALYVSSQTKKESELETKEIKKALVPPTSH